jgi:hypothetical protein
MFIILIHNRVLPLVLHIVTPLFIHREAGHIAHFHQWVLLETTGRWYSTICSIH